MFKPTPGHNPLTAPAICLCIGCCKIVDELRCPARDEDGNRCGDYKHRGRSHTLLVATTFQIVDERLGR